MNWNDLIIMLILVAIGGLAAASCLRRKNRGCGGGCGGCNGCGGCGDNCDQCCSHSRDEGDDTPRQN